MEGGSVCNVFNNIIRLDCRARVGVDRRHARWPRAACQRTGERRWRMLVHCACGGLCRYVLFALSLSLSRLSFVFTTALVAPWQVEAVELATMEKTVAMGVTVCYLYFLSCTLAHARTLVDPFRISLPL